MKRLIQAIALSLAAAITAGCASAPHSEASINDCAANGGTFQWQGSIKRCVVSDPFSRNPATLAVAVTDNLSHGPKHRN